jgi:hypothetical protein
MVRGKTSEIAIEPTYTGRGYSSIFGILLIGLGAVMGVLAFIRYKKVEEADR